VPAHVLVEPVLRRYVSSSLLLVAALVIANPARANGRFPKANQLVVAPGAPDVMTLRTTFGVLYSSDRGEHWDWICESAVGYPPGTNEDPSIAITASKAIVVRPDAPHTAFALTSTYVSADDAGAATFNARLYGTTDDGATWAPFGVPIDPTTLSETVEVAKSDPHRYYISAVKGAGMSATGLLFVSNDDGATWAPRPIPIDPSVEHAPFIAAVDPANADRIYVRTGGGTTQSRLLVSDDAGKNFRVAYTGKPMLGFALSPDGSKVFLGGIDGLFVANKTDLAFTQRSSILVQCLATSGTTLYACSSESSGFILGASGDDGATFAPKLHLSTVRGPLACAPGTKGHDCASEWPALRDALGAGSTDAGMGDTGPSVPTLPSKGCGCDVAASSSNAWWGGGFFAILGCAWFARWRARKK
jgi:hypothetical protein